MKKKDKKLDNLILIIAIIAFLLAMIITGIVLYNLFIKGN